MHIQYFGHSCFKITTKNNGQDINIGIDPFDKQAGLKVPHFSADILLITHDHFNHNNIQAIKGTGEAKQPFLINGPGEYEIKGVFIHGTTSAHDNQQGHERGDNTIFFIQTEDLSLAHLGDLGQTQLTDIQLEIIEGVDILIIPVGGTYTIDAKQATSIISQIEPRIIIPMHYKVPGLKIDKLDSVDNFIQEMGVKAEVVDKLKITKKDLPQEETKVIVFRGSKWI